MLFSEHKCTFGFINNINVFCVAVCAENNVRLNGGEGTEFYRRGTFSGAQFMLDELSRGRVEICHNGEYRAVCADQNEGWDNRDAMVVCRELGFSPYGENYIVIKQ